MWLLSPSVGPSGFWRAPPHKVGNKTRRKRKEASTHVKQNHHRLLFVQCQYNHSTCSKPVSTRSKSQSIPSSFIYERRTKLRNRFDPGLSKSISFAPDLETRKAKKTQLQASRGTALLQLRPQQLQKPQSRRSCSQIRRSVVGLERKGSGISNQISRGS